MTTEELMKLIGETKTDEVREIAKAIVEWIDSGFATESAKEETKIPEPEPE